MFDARTAHQGPATRLGNRRSARCPAQWTKSAKNRQPIRKKFYSLVLRIEIYLLLFLRIQLSSESGISLNALSEARAFFMSLNTFERNMRGERNSVIVYKNSGGKDNVNCY